MYSGERCPFLKWNWLNLVYYCIAWVSGEGSLLLAVPEPRHAAAPGTHVCPHPHLLIFPGCPTPPVSGHTCPWHLYFCIYLHPPSSKGVVPDSRLRWLGDQVIKSAEQVRDLTLGHTWGMAGTGTGMHVRGCQRCTHIPFWVCARASVWPWGLSRRGLSPAASGLGDWYLPPSLPSLMSAVWIPPRYQILAQCSIWTMVYSDLWTWRSSLIPFYLESYKSYSFVPNETYKRKTITFSIICFFCFYYWVTSVICLPISNTLWMLREI